jgi:hypothetical protein
MRDRLHIRFWGLHVTADGRVAIAVALVIVLAALLVYRL